MPAKPREEEPPSKLATALDDAEAPKPAKTPAKAEPVTLEAFTESLDKAKQKQLERLQKQLAQCEKESDSASDSATKTFAEKAKTCIQLRELLGDHYRAYMKKHFKHEKSHAARWAQAGQVLKVASPRGDDVFLTSEAHTRPLASLSEDELIGVLDRLKQWRKWAPTSELTPAWCEAAAQLQKPDPKPNTDPSAKAEVVAKVLEHFKSVQEALPDRPTKALTESIENFEAEVSILGQQSSTGIAWTQATWNPLHGCAHASKCCD